jgi:hypothetical protein
MPHRSQDVAAQEASAMAAQVGAGNFVHANRVALKQHASDISKSIDRYQSEQTDNASFR